MPGWRTRIGAGEPGLTEGMDLYSSPMQTMARVPVQQHADGLNGSSDALPQANFLLQYWQIGQEPEG